MAEVLEKLDPDFRIPYDEAAIKSGDPIRLADYNLELVKTLEELLRRLTDVANFALSLSDGGIVYYALPDSITGAYPDGTWRRLQVGSSLVDQKLIDGTWTEVHVREEPE